MMQYKPCDLCGLNRATLHLDEVVEGTIQATAHLCDDCWYRLGIRIPLGNIWNHIQRAKELLRSDPISPEDEAATRVDDDDLDELLDPGNLAVAEPDEDDDFSLDDIDEALSNEGDSSFRNASLDLENLLDPSGEEEEDEVEGQRPGITAFHVGKIHPSLVSLFPHEMLVRCKAIPIRLEGTQVTVVLADPFDVISRTNIEMYLEKLGYTFVHGIADEEEIMRELQRHSEPPEDFNLMS